jgi:cell division protein ZapA
MLTQAVSRVDQEMCAIRDAGRIRARERIAVLAALNLAYQLVQAPSSAPSAEALSGDFTELLSRLDKALAADGQLL